MEPLSPRIPSLPLPAVFRGPAHWELRTEGVSQHPLSLPTQSIPQRAGAPQEGPSGSQQGAPGAPTSQHQARGKDGGVG